MRTDRVAAGSLAVIVAFALLVVTACASPDRPAIDGASEQADVLLCQRTEVPVQALEEARPATELAPDAAPAFDGREVPDLDPAEWLIIEESDERVVLMRKLARPEDLGFGEIREYELVTISTEFPPTTTDESAWMLVGWGSCALRIDLGALASAGIALDPASPPAPEADRVMFLVTEFACNSGQDAAGRVELVELTETDSTVELVIGVRPSSGELKACPANPPTPFTVELGHPLGDRAILDAAVVPARELTASEEVH